MSKTTLLESGLSRRDLLRTAGCCALGATTITTLAVPAPAHAVVAADRWPWPYVKLDPQTTADLAYEEWYRVFCGAAVVVSVFRQLREKVGEPYASFPMEAFGFLEGGISGWGTICGACAGANIVTNVILGPRTATGKEDGMLMGSELLQHYASTAMPTYAPKAPKVKGDIPKTVSDSPLCHVSVGKWMKAANKELASPERKDRCARLTASMAARTVTLLNDWKDGKYKTAGIVPAKKYAIQSQHNCFDCHADPPSPPGVKK